MAVNIEDAGFEIRDLIAWIYGSGFPKSLDVAKAIQKSQGIELQVIGDNPNHRPKSVKDNTIGDYNPNSPGNAHVKAVTTPEAKQWNGWGTALKPAMELWTLARKPLIGTVAENVLKYGTGGINVDGCRVDFQNGADRKESTEKNQHEDFGTKPMTGNNVYGDYSMVKPRNYNPPGRFPANVIHDGSEEVVGGFPNVGNGNNGVPYNYCGRQYSNKNTSMFNGDKPNSNSNFNDSGSAARFFYCAKSSREDRDDGLDNTRIVKHNIPKGVLSCEESMALVESLQKVMSADGLDAKWLTGENGASIMGLCRLDSLSTTLTAISKITPLKILNSLQPKITRESTVDANCEMENGGSLAVSAEKSSRLNQVITSVSLELAPGASLVVSQMLSTISVAANWKPLTNFHSTVKPTDLMRYLCRLVTPPNGIILDPFFGSGSTGKAAKLEFFNYIGIEREKEYCEIAQKRIDAVIVSKKLNFK